MPHSRRNGIGGSSGAGAGRRRGRHASVLSRRSIRSEISVQEQLEVNGFSLIAISLEHAAGVADLPFHHRDPFDRLLVAQALAEGLSLVSADPIFRRYGVTRVW
jgi:PIN domain nuclease of toxin-antitoxin system